MTESSVRVAVRIRPQIPSEVFDMCHVCTSVTPGEPQVWVGNDKGFTFDHVFNMNTSQDNVYSSCIKDLLDGCFSGYNATILAYGQTGSGKTYTMGSGFDVSINEEEIGIIPRAVNQLFNGIARLQNEAQNNKTIPPEFKVVAQFMELYNEEIIDLFEDKGTRSNVKIHEDPNGQIVTSGLTSRSVSSASETLQCLKIGALSRTTASTKMNAQSSRSHAIFTLHIKQQRISQFESEEECMEIESLEEFDTLTSKLHFVDLAGSERLKRTGATGERAREGISINCGLLALGNVISALGDKNRKATHVPYRDSKLTRLLQDSLGGNSQTLMIACVSPSDRDFMETLNTLKYANRAKNIRNRISINQDKSSQTISLLRREIQQLQLELMEYKQGKRSIGDDGEEQVNDMFHENKFLESENNNLRSRLKALQETLDQQTKRVTELLSEKAAGSWITTGENSSQSDITELIKGYMKEIEDLRVKLLEAEEMCSQLRRQLQRNQNRLSNISSPLLNSSFDCFEEPRSPYDVLREAKQDVKILSRHVKALEKQRIEDNGSEDPDDEKEKNDATKDKVNEENVNGDIDEEEEESSDESDSDDKSSAETCDLAQITQDISIKQKLIEALEQSQQRLKKMRLHYEGKVTQLENKIKETQQERDRVLANLSNNKENKSEEKVKRVKEEFGKKLGSLQKELKKMQVVKKEHVQAMRNQAHCERQIQQLRNEVSDMKKTKVRLINKMKEDSKANLQNEQRRNKEIAQLKKQGRMKENQIKSLEAEKRLKENVLKRKQEEIMALRKSNKPMSDRVAGRVARFKDETFTIHERKVESPKAAKIRWQNLEKDINQLAINRQSITNTERDMNRFFKEREQLTRELECLNKKKVAACSDKKNPEVIRELEDEIESLKANINYCQENINECQTTIVQMEVAKDFTDLLDVEKFVSNLGMNETRYLLGKLLNMSISQTFQVFQKEGTVKELEAKLKQSEDLRTVHLQLLERLSAEGDTEILNFVTETDEQATWSQSSSRSSSPAGIFLESSSISEVSIPQIPQATSESTTTKSKKRPRKTGLPSEFMALDPQPVLDAAGSSPSVNDPTDEKSPQSRMAWSFGPSLKQELDLDKTLTTSVEYPVENRGIVRVTSAPTSLQETTVSDVSPPGSPSGSRKTRDDNVFSRLTNGSFRLNKPESGVIAPFSSKMNLDNNKSSPLICTHTAEGHSRAVLSLHATSDLLFSGSKDRTVKIWDLNTGKEVQSLGGHPTDVVAVRYSESSQLAFTASSSFIKVWDVRENPAGCVRTLCSSGLANAGMPTFIPHSRVPRGESVINDIALNRYGTTLFSAASTNVRIWELRKFTTFGRLNGNNLAAIMCLAVDSIGDNRNVVVTGSKDHYIKVFEISDDSEGIITPKTNLDPPHYDGVESLAVSGNFLWSASRDTCIKKWNLTKRKKCLVHSINQAHNNWVCALDFIANDSLLVSGCRGGSLKLWSTENQPVGEVKAHSAPINAISTNSTSIFTASSDCTIKIWQLKDSNDLSPDNNEISV